MDVVVGATGILGSEIVRQLRAQGRSVRAVVRKTSDAEKTAALKEAGADLVVADLKDPSSLSAAVDGADTVISTASSTLSRGEGDTIESVDHIGQKNLVDAAAKAGVGHFVFVSFAAINADFPLQSVKRSVEAHLEAADVPHTTLQPTNFTEVWLSPALGFDAAAGKARILGTGDAKINWISFKDVARYTVAAAGNDAVKGQTIPLGGPAALSQNDIVGIFERVGGKKFEIENVPEDALRAGLGSPDALQASFSGLMINCSNGGPTDTSKAEVLGVDGLSSVEDFAKAILG